MSSSLKEKIIKLGEHTVLTNKQISNIVNCSEKTVRKYIGSYIERCVSKVSGESSTEIQKIVLLPDIHHPHYEEKVMHAINQFIADYKPNELVYMGDQMSLDCISSWNRNKPLLKEGKRLIKDYLDFDRDVLQVHESITSKDTRRIFMFGNHEQRVVWYTESNPELEGFIDINKTLQLEERGYKIVPFNEVYNIGKLNIIHGFYYNKYHAAKTLEAFEGNVVYCHVHNPQSFTKVSPVDQKGYHTATSLPCICSIRPEYKGKRPNFWVNGFAILEYMPIDGFFNLYPITINEGTFMFNGKYYGNSLWN